MGKDSLEYNRPRLDVWALLRMALLGSILKNFVSGYQFTSKRTLVITRVVPWLY